MSFARKRDARAGGAEFAAFGWNPEEIPDPQAVETFERSKLNWSEHEAEAPCRLAGMAPAAD